MGIVLTEVRTFFASKQQISISLNIALVSKYSLAVFALSFNHSFLVEHDYLVNPKNSMANNTSNSTYHHKSNGTQFPLSTSKCIPWFAGFTTECLAIIILNIIIIIFVKQR